MRSRLQHRPAMYPAREGYSHSTCVSTVALIYFTVVFPSLRHSAGKADKLQGKVPASVARKKPSTPAYAAVSPAGRRPAQTAKETSLERTDKTSAAATTGTQQPSLSATKVLVTQTHSKVTVTRKSE